MELKILNEAGLDEALIGMKFSFQPECDIEDISHIISYHDGSNDILYDENYMETAKKLCKKDGGHNKFLEQIQVWMIIRAPLYFWKQMDTYRVGTSKLSKSTMHTLMKRELTEDDFEGKAVWLDTIDKLNACIHIGKSSKDKTLMFKEVNDNLPQSFLQTRMVNTNYKVLRNMILQRKNHKLKEWDYFVAEMFSQLNNVELLGIDFRL